ncbi:hypothetical protein [Streptomyces mirabilis]|uniref:hypothetical protein n=1 Tax=Streptomyces mirabilis TaxID=68239 RepID=UPI003680E499
MIYVGIFLATSTPFLLLAGERISKRIREARARRRRLAWLEERIRTERNSACRAAWRMIRDHELEGL